MNRRQFIVCGATLLTAGRASARRISDDLTFQGLFSHYEFPSLSPYISDKSNLIHYRDFFLPLCNYVKHDHYWLNDLQRYNSYYNHLHFWNGLSNKPGTPARALNTIIEASLGSMARLYTKMKEVCFQSIGSGWIVVKSIDNREVVVDFVSNDDERIPSSVLISIDIWEHAYYLDFSYDQEAYLDSIKNLIDWNVINQRAFSSKLI